MKKIFIILLIILLSACYENNKNNDDVYYYKHFMERMLENREVEYLSNGWYCPEIKNITLLINDTLTLEKILQKEKEAVFFRFSDSECIDCIDAELQTINNMEISERNHVYFLVSYSNMRNLKINLDKYKGFINRVFLVDNRFLDIKVEKLNIPYYFKVNRNYFIYNVFIPFKSDPEFSKVFLQIKAKINRLP
ncbi:MAG: hypothetical protein LBR48_06360 [Dysgonamonadaceae bacterium]|nr:hypothetical protein [Dysgonamonadaceae bacterium]